jgi:hypothetical protein
VQALGRRQQGQGWEWPGPMNLLKKGL